MRSGTSRSGQGGTGFLRGAPILITADAVGGVWTYATDLAQGLSRRGATVVLVVLGPPPSREQRAAALQGSGIELVETGLPLDWTAETPAQVVDAGLAVARLAEARGAALVHLNSPALAACGTFAQPVVSVCHSCVATWWDAVRGTALPPEFAWRRDLVARGYASADALVAPSAAFARATGEAYGIPTPFVVHNGRVPAAVQPGVPGDGPGLVFTAGRLWDEGKNLALLDRAAARLSLPVAAAGPQSGPNGARIELRHVQALGQLSGGEIARRLAARPIFCSPALYEPFGLAVLEAAAAGCPLVLSDIPTFRELWGDAARLVPPHDETALVDAIEAIAADPAGRRRLGAAARLRAQAYSAEAMVAGTVEIYRKALARRSGRKMPAGLRAAPQKAGRRQGVLQ
jgi:glycogen(starch) synthase